MTKDVNEPPEQRLVQAYADCPPEYIRFLLAQLRPGTEDDGYLAAREKLDAGLYPSSTTTDFAGIPSPGRDPVAPWKELNAGVLLPLRELFPDRDRWELRERVDAERDSMQAYPLSYGACLFVLYRTADGLLKQEDRSLPMDSLPTQKLGATSQSLSTSIVPYRSEAYVQCALRRLCAEFPIAKAMIPTVFHNAQQDYATAHQRISVLCERHSWFLTVSSFVVNAMPSNWNWWSSSSSSSSLSSSAKTSATSTSSSTATDNHDEEPQELMEDVWRVEHGKMLQLCIKDSELALDCSRQEYEGQGMVCECCFSDHHAMEEMVCCREGHLLCVECVQRFIQEMLYGQQKTQCGSVDGLACFAMSGSSLSGSSVSGSCSTTPCTAEIPLSILQHQMQDSSLYQQLLQHLQQQQIQQSKLSHVRCAHCKNVEFLNPASSLWNRTSLLLSVAVTVPAVFMATAHGAFLPAAIFIASLCTLSAVGWQWIYGKKNPFQPSRPQPLSYMTGDTYRCASCEQWTCLACQEPLLPFHRCHTSGEEEQLRIHVEKAMSAAVIRTCPQCQAGLVKEDGCNKLVCKCGHSMCYVCGKDIGRERYAHFCQHFRPVSGKPCSKCNACDLWKCKEEERLVRDAAEKARQEFLQQHPQLAKRILLEEQTRSARQKKKLGLGTLAWWKKQTRKEM